MSGGASLLRHFSPSPSSCPDLFRASTSCGIAVRARKGRGGGGTWMPGTSPLLSGLTSGRALCRQTGPSPLLRCHPGLDPGSREAGRERCLWPWTPDQVRGDSGGERTAGAGGSRPVSRSGGRAGNPPLPTPCTGSAPSKPDSSGTSPGMTEELSWPSRLSSRRYKPPNYRGRCAGIRARVRA